MTQADYMKRLEKNIQKLPPARRQEILDDIRAHFTEGVASGKEEAALCESLGPPELLAREYRSIHAAERAKDDFSAGNVFRANWAGFGMLLLNVIFVVPIAAGVFAVWVSLAAAGIAMAVAGFFSMFAVWFGGAIVTIVVPVAYPIAGFFAALLVCALGLLLCIGMFYAGRALLRVTKQYLQANLTIITGRRKSNG